VHLLAWGKVYSPEGRSLHSSAASKCALPVAETFFAGADRLVL